MRALRFVLGDQLSAGLSSLRDIDPASDIVLMTEVMEESTNVRHHKQKIAFLFAAMRHFAAALRSRGVAVDYVKLDGPGNTGSFTGELERAIARHRPERVVATEASEWRVLEMQRAWAARTGLPCELREDDRFICSRARFERWAAGRKGFRMEFFFREMRRETGFLMAGDEPEGGQWNFDAENRKRLPVSVTPPPRRRFTPDADTREVLALVATRFPDHFGDLDGFGWAVTREGAREALDHFIAHCLPNFGDYQDAMKTGAPFLFHSIISPYLNAGLLDAREICIRAEAAYRAGQAPINAAEGFIRQILGWREYVRGLYWLKMPDYARTNALNARRKLPWFYWSGETAMACVRDVVEVTRRHAYAHHIQRLMITGNFALLAGIDPVEVEAWYLAVYADAFDWVELPNTHGMALFADGGLLASKPYAASGAYINRMSDYCSGCAYSPDIKTGPGACPFNFLYWNFLIENRNALAANPRMAMPYRTLDKMEEARVADIKRDADAFLRDMDGATKPRGLI